MWLRAKCDSYISWGAFHGHKNQSAVTDEDGGGSSVFHKCWLLATEMIIDLFLHRAFPNFYLNPFLFFSPPIKPQKTIVVLKNTILSTTFESTCRMCFQLSTSVHSVRWNACLCYWWCKLMLKSSSRPTISNGSKTLAHGLDYSSCWSTKRVRG